MKITKTMLIMMLCVLLALLSGCKAPSSAETGASALPTKQSGEASPAVDETIHAEEATGEFVITTEDGAFTQNDNVYTITAGGTYVLRGRLEGRIIVEAGKAAEVTLELSDTTIICDSDSPVKILSADKVEISAKKKTGNIISDTRTEKQEDDPLQGEGAIHSKADLKLKGSGTLIVNAGYNNGIHCTKDIEIQKLSLKVTAVNNSIKGKDSVTITSGVVAAVSMKGDGIKTENTDANKNGKTRGDITICGGRVSVYSAGDGIQAAHDFVMMEGEKNSGPYIAVYTGSYSGYTAEDAATESYKGVKVQNAIQISAGTIELSTYDDGLHANYGTAFDSGETGAGTVIISGGSVIMAIYSPEGATGGGRVGPGGVPGGAPGGHGGGPGGVPGGVPGGPGGWGGQKTVSGADAIHADYKIYITAGDIYIDSAYEGLEANVINITGGYTVVTAADDGVNATKGIEPPQIIINGGVLDVAVSPNGDTDGIDSNGSYSQDGGLVITRGPNMEMAGAIDAETEISISGGTLIVLGCGTANTGNAVKPVSLSLNSEGTHTITVDGEEYTFTNAYNYSGTSCWSDCKVTGK